MKKTKGISHLKKRKAPFGANQYHVIWWRGRDSNSRTLTRADLQSAAINHSATPPQGLLW